MTSQKSHGVIEFYCDECGQVWEPETKLGRGSEPRTVQEAWEDAKSQGWRARKSALDEWQHFCPECK
jgi:hypothetical protein